jgi:hypothetical protein
MNEQEKNELLFQHPEFHDMIEYVRPSNQSRNGYWRIKPTHRMNPSRKQLQARQDLAKIAYKNYGAKGFVDGVPVIAHRIGEGMRKKTPRSTRRPLIETVRILSQRFERLRALRVIA